MSDPSQSYSRILVVDDDPLIRDMMIDLLEGYTVETARNGREALTKLQGVKDYLVFLDLMMPVMSGEEPALHSHHKIILMSAASLLAQTYPLNV